LPRDIVFDIGKIWFYDIFAGIEENDIEFFAVAVYLSMITHLS